VKFWKPKSVGSGIAAAVGLVLAILGIVQAVQRLIPNPKVPQVSAVFVLDVSPAMRGGRLGKTTKLAAAENGILQSVASYPGISTSLRLVTAGCKMPSNKKPTVGFATNNADAYRKVFANLPEESVSSYFEGLNSAANDLTTKELIQDSEQKLLIVFVADPSYTCGSPFGLSIGRGLSVSFYWLGASNVGLGGVRRQLEDLGFTDVKVHGPHTKKELKGSVTRTMAPRPHTTPTGTTTAETTTAETTTAGTTTAGTTTAETTTAGTTTAGTTAPIPP
jgi:hypothetical protein